MNFPLSHLSTGMPVGTNANGNLAAAGIHNDHALRQHFRFSRRSSIESRNSDISITTSSSQGSVASSATSQSSIASRQDWDRDDWSTTSSSGDAYDPVARYAFLLRESAERLSRGSADVHPGLGAINPLESMCNVTVPHLKTGVTSHPRRIAVPNPRRALSSDSWQKPSLVRDTEQREVLVERLVVSSAHAVSLMWPSADADGTNRNVVIPLQLFIRETLKRSRTSHSTLQVALYYLALIKSKDSKAPSLQCGRRMFLSALILASKYLQDRNFSSKAWSKICGLNPREINSNEVAFLAAIDWQLHVTTEAFEQWIGILGKCTDLVKIGVSRVAWTAVVETLKMNLSLDRMQTALAAPKFEHLFPLAKASGVESNVSLELRNVVTCSHPTVSGSQASTCALSALLTTSVIPTPAVGRDLQSFQANVVTASLQHRIMARRPPTPPQTPPNVAITVAPITQDMPLRLRNTWLTAPLTSSPASMTPLSFPNDFYPTQDLRLPSIRHLMGLSSGSSGEFPIPSALGFPTATRQTRSNGAKLAGRPITKKRSFCDLADHEAAALTLSHLAADASCKKVRVHAGVGVQYSGSGAGAHEASSDRSMTWPQ